MNRKVVYNNCYGGFGLSPIAQKMLYEIKNPGKTLWFYKRIFSPELNGMDVYEKITGDLKEYKGSFVQSFSKDMGDSFTHKFGERDEDFEDHYVWIEEEIGDRTDPDLVRVVEELGTEVASGSCAKLEIVDIGDSKYHIDEYDGMEWVSTRLPEGYWK